MLIQINLFLERIDFKSMHPTVCESYSSINIYLMSETQTRLTKLHTFNS